jgi:molybdate transport system regulatory protein
MYFAAINNDRTKTGSIKAAALSTNMSPMTAWLLLEEINTLLREPAVSVERGGAGGGGGATLTPVGQKLIQHYHSIEKRTRAAARREFRALRRLLHA